MTQRSLLQRDISLSQWQINVFALLWIATLLIAFGFILMAMDLKHSVGTQYTLFGAADEKPNATHGEDARRFEYPVLRKHQPGLENNPSAIEE